MRLTRKRFENHGLRPGDVEIDFPILEGPLPAALSSAEHPASGVPSAHRRVNRRFCGASTTSCNPGVGPLSACKSIGAAQGKARPHRITDKSRVAPVSLAGSTVSLVPTVARSDRWPFALQRVGPIRPCPLQTRPASTSSRSENTWGSVIGEPRHSRVFRFSPRLSRLPSPQPIRSHGSVPL